MSEIYIFFRTEVVQCIGNSPVQCIGNSPPQYLNQTILLMAEYLFSDAIPPRNGVRICVVQPWLGVLLSNVMIAYLFFFSNNKNLHLLCLYKVTLHVSIDRRIPSKLWFIANSINDSVDNLFALI